MEENFDMHVERFRSMLQAFMDDYHTREGNTGSPPKITLMYGPKYIRIVRNDPGRSSYGFIDKSNGDLLYSASWAAPAKRARGSIFNSNPLSGCGPYGMQMLRG